MEWAVLDNNSVITLQNVVMDFHVGGGLFKKNKIRALNDISFTLKKRRALALVGESGSGKSTCARIISGIYTPTKGAVLYQKKALSQMTSSKERLKYKRSVQMIFQDPFGSLNPTHSIFYHLKRPLVIHHGIKDKRHLTERVHKLLETVGLTPVQETKKKFPHELSGGQRQRVAIARVLAVEPDVILADEPTSMLDVSIRVGVLNLMEDLKTEQNIAFLYITHDIATARYFAEETAVMYVGHIVEWGGSENITLQPKHPYTQLLIDSVPDPSKSFAKRRKRGERSEIPIWTPEHKGCPFAGRCPHVMDLCKKDMPHVTVLEENHFVRCFLFK